MAIVEKEGDFSVLPYHPLFHNLHAPMLNFVLFKVWSVTSIFNIATELIIDTISFPVSDILNQKSIF